MLRDQLDIAPVGNGLPSWNAQILAKRNGRRVELREEGDRGEKEGRRSDGGDWVYG